VTLELWLGEVLGRWWQLPAEAKLAVGNTLGFEETEPLPLDAAAAEAAAEANSDEDGGNTNNRRLFSIEVLSNSGSRTPNTRELRTPLISN
jgi:hypothetical protein